MLVVDQDADSHFKSHKITPSSTDSTTRVITCPDTQPQVNGATGKNNRNRDSSGIYTCRFAAIIDSIVTTNL